MAVGGGRKNAGTLNSRTDRFPEQEHDDGVEPRRQPDHEVAAVHCRAFTICARSSCTMSWKSVREGHLEIARPRNVDLALDQDAAGPRRHDEHAVGEEHRLAQVVGDEDDGDLARRVQVADHAPQLLARERIERAERLVEHQQLRFVDQRAAERGALLHAAGQLPRDISRPGRASPTEVSRFSARATYSARCAADFAAMRLDDLERQQEVFQRRAPGQQGRRLERHAGDLDRLADELARDLDRALERKLQAGRELHQGGLAAAGRADHCGELALLDRDREVLRPRARRWPPP